MASAAKGKSKSSKNSAGNSTLKSAGMLILLFAGSALIGWYPFASVYSKLTASKTAKPSSAVENPDSHVAANVVTPMPPIKETPNSSNVIKIDESKDENGFSKPVDIDGAPKVKTGKKKAQSQSDDPITIEEGNTGANKIDSDKQSDTSNDSKPAVSTDSSNNASDQDVATKSDNTDKPKKVKRKPRRDSDSNKPTETKKVLTGEGIDR